MEQEGQEQGQLCGGSAPEPDEDGTAGLHGRERKQAQCVVGEMSGREQEEDEAGPQSQSGQIQGELPPTARLFRHMSPHS